MHCPFDKIFGVETDEHDCCLECPYQTWEDCKRAKKKAEENMQEENIGKVHLRDSRLFVNAGMSFPLCVANAEMLDCDKSHWKITTDVSKVTCKNCLKNKIRRGI